MRTDRRRFIKVAGVALLGLSVKPAIDGLVGRGLAEASPLVALLPTRQWAMVVDMPKCVKAGDCTDCIVACNQAHNVPLFENAKEEIKWLWTEPYPNVFREAAHSYTNTALYQARIPVLCNHCENPACVRVCPTQATWRRADGIVMMDEHRCIGCRYCMVACPYGARSFNYRDPRQGLNMDAVNPDFPTRARGVVEKCNFCVERLAKNLPPACVEACDEMALTFGDLNDPKSAVRALLSQRPSQRRGPEYGTSPQVYYLV